jgi:hypothetical protein
MGLKSKRTIREDIAAQAIQPASRTPTIALISSTSNFILSQFGRTGQELFFQN